MNKSRHQDRFAFSFRDRILSKFSIPSEFCKQNEVVDCTDKVDFRMPNGLCNNLVRPYDGNSHTAFARLEPAAYADCRQID